MTDISALIAELKQNRITLQAINGQLKVEAHNEVLTEQLCQTITEHRTAILAYLTTESAVPGKANALTDRQPGKMLSYAQRHLWFMTRQPPAHAFYHVKHAYTIAGKLNQKALQTALEQLLQRHETLRCTIGFLENEPKLVPQTEFQLSIQFHDLTHLAGSEQTAGLSAAMQPLLDLPFKLETELPCRAGVFSLASNKNILVIVIHHLATDPWAGGILRRELSQLYVNAKTGIPHSLPKLTIQYPDFAVWQQQWLESDTLNKQLAFWRKELQDLNPILNLPTDFPRPAVANLQAGEWIQNFDAEFLKALRNFSRSHNVTIFMALMVALQILFYRLSGQNDFALATPVTNRQRQDLENLLGYFVNPLLIRASLNAEDNFLTLLQVARKRTLAALNYPHLPFNLLVQELYPDRSHEFAPLAQVFIALQNLQNRKNNWGDLQVEAYKLPKQDIRFDLEIHIREENGQLQLAWLYRKDLWTEATLQQWGACLHTLLAQSMQSPTCKIGAQQQILQQWGEVEVLSAPAITLPEDATQDSPVESNAVDLSSEESFPEACLEQRGSDCRAELVRENQNEEKADFPSPHPKLLPEREGAFSASVLEPTLHQKLLALALDSKESRLHVQSLIYQFSEPSNLPALYLCGGAKEIAAHCPAYQIFGLQTAFGLMPLTAENIRTLASHYVQEVLAHNPDGPYRVGGYDIGGRIAYEMALHLQASGKTVALLLLIDQLLYEPYAGNIAFFILQQNNVLHDLHQPGSSKVLLKYFPHGWTVDLVPGQHTPVIEYVSAMVLAERISARATSSPFKPLAKTACHVQWQLLDLEQDEVSVTLTLILKNTSNVNWPAGQIAIGHHWQDLQGVLIYWAVDTMTLSTPIPMGRNLTIKYTLAKPAENHNVFVIIDLLDKGNTWFSLSGAASFRTMINISLPEHVSVPDLQQLHTLYAQGKLQTVIPLYQQALTAYPESHRELELKLAQALAQAGRAADARTVLINALAQSTASEQDTARHLLLAEIYLNAGTFAAAITEIEQVLAQQKHNPQALAILGLANAHLGQLVVAKQAFDQAIAQFTDQSLPAQFIAQLDAFNFLLDKYNHPDSVKYVQILLDKDALNPIHRFNCAYFLFRRKQFQAAENMLLHALEIHPAHPVFSSNLAKLYLEQENYTAAASTYRQLTRQSPLKIENFVMLAKIRLHQEQYQAALDILEQASKINAEDASVLQCRAEIKKARHKNH